MPLDRNPKMPFLAGAAEAAEEAAVALLAAGAAVAEDALAVATGLAVATLLEVGCRRQRAKEQVLEHAVNRFEKRNAVYSYLILRQGVLLFQRRCGTGTGTGGGGGLRGLRASSRHLRLLEGGLSQGRERHSEHVSVNKSEAKQ